MNEQQKAWLEHIIRVEKYSFQIDRLYRWAIKEFVKLGYVVKGSFDPERKEFEFASYPGLTARVNRILRIMHKELTAIIAEGAEREWYAAHATNDRLIDDILKTYAVPREVLEKMKYRNLESLKAFQTSRKFSGMNLSERVWNYTKTFEQEMESIVDLGLREGKTATKIAQEAEPLLKEPNRLYRRVRDARGKLWPSKNAKKYNPGRGTYRSSHQNAKRMSRTETNMAYRVADHERRMAQPFIVGYEVKRSNNPYPCPVCDAFKGKYPKSYIFRSQHPNCRCVAIAILATPAEIESWIEAGAEGPLDSVNEIKAMPDGWRTWVRENKQRLLTAKEPPYWAVDNFKNPRDPSKGLKIDIPI